MDGTSVVLGIGCGTELRMMQAEQISSVPHAASRALSLLLENIEMVALKEPTTVVSQVQRSHVALVERVSPEWHRLLRTSWQLHTDVSSFLHKLIGIGEVRLLSVVAGRVPWAFRWLFIKVHEHIF